MADNFPKNNEIPAPGLFNVFRCPLKCELFLTQYNISLKINFNTSVYWV